VYCPPHATGWVDCGSWPWPSPSRSRDSAVQDDPRFTMFRAWLGGPSTRHRSWSSIGFVWKKHMIILGKEIRGDWEFHSWNMGCPA
jgi:hypothetical protein